MKTTGKLRRYIYVLTLFFITLSGFGQMPIFKRYYIADIPGLGWLAQFYVTHIIHYAAASVLIALVLYILFDFIFNGSGLNRDLVHLSLCMMLLCVSLYTLIWEKKWVN